MSYKIERLHRYFIFTLSFCHKFRWAFRMYDKDNSGSIELAEMIEIIGTLYEMEGVSKVNIKVFLIIYRYMRKKDRNIEIHCWNNKYFFVYLGKCFRKSEKDFR